jgi:hypothetical protein
VCFGGGVVFGVANGNHPKCHTTTQHSIALEPISLNDLGQRHSLLETPNRNARESEFLRKTEIESSREREREAHTSLPNIPSLYTAELFILQENKAGSASTILFYRTLFGYYGNGDHDDNGGTCTTTIAIAADDNGKTSQCVDTFFQDTPEPIVVDVVVVVNADRLLFHIF